MLLGGDTNPEADVSEMGWVLLYTGVTTKWGGQSPPPCQTCHPALFRWLYQGERVSFPCKSLLIRVSNSPNQTLLLQGKEDWIRVGWDPRSERAYGNIGKPVIQWKRTQDSTHSGLRSLVKAPHYLLCPHGLTRVPSLTPMTQACDQPWVDLKLFFLFLMA